MEKEIQGLLDQIEQEKNVKILYACESGSRAWGFPSPDSDFDVRFIYKHDRDWYLSINEKKDTITFMPDKLLDGSGWDIRKWLRLLYKSNCTTFEWLNSPIVYRKEERVYQELKNLSKAFFLPLKVIYHYLGIASKMLQKEFQGNQVKIKKYFYVLRPVLAARWIIMYQTPPPLRFQELLPNLENQTILDLINDLLKQKETAAEGHLVDKIPILDEFIRREMDIIEALATRIEPKRNDFEKLNIFYRKMLGV